VIRLERHVKKPDCNQQPEKGFETIPMAAADHADQNAQDRHVNEALQILAVIDCSYAGNETQEEGQSR
jgi:hypothetical protein